MVRTAFDFGSTLFSLSQSQLCFPHLKVNFVFLFSLKTILDLVISTTFAKTWRINEGEVKDLCNIKMLSS